MSHHSIRYHSPRRRIQSVSSYWITNRNPRIEVQSLEDQNERNFRYRYQTADPDTFKNERISGDDRVTLRKFFHETKTKYVNLYNCTFPPTQHNGITPTQ